MKIKLHLLRQAHALATHGNFSRAAEALKVSQPALSRGIKELEAQVGIPLFDRSRAANELTDFGRVFMERAADLVSDAADLEREVALAKGLATGEISVGAGPYAMEALVPVCTAGFAAAHPGVRLRILMDSPAVLARMVRTRAVDLAVAEASILEDHDDLIVIARLAPLKGYVVVRAGHPLTRNTDIKVADALDYPFAQVVMLSPRLLKPIIAARRLAAGRPGTPLPPFPAIECPTLRLAVSIVMNSNAFTFATLGTVRAELESGQIVALLHEPWIRSEWAIVHRRKRTMSPAMTAFVAQLERAQAEVAQVDELLHRRWYRPNDAHRESPKPRRTPAKSKPARRLRKSPAAGRR